jgi:hypothetical protein
VHFETLRASSFQTTFKTMLIAIRICTHRLSLPDPVPGSVISDRCPVHLNSIADRTPREVPNGPCVSFTAQTAKPCTTKATKYLEVFGSQAFPSCTFVPLVVNGFAIDPQPNAVIPCPRPKDVKKF